jgi:hypothetical protein
MSQQHSLRFDFQLHHVTLACGDVTIVKINDPHIFILRETNKTKKKREVMTCTQATKRKQYPTKHRWENGYLNMIPNQRQR